MPLFFVPVGSPGAASLLGSIFCQSSQLCSAHGALGGEQGQGMVEDQQGQGMVEEQQGQGMVEEQQ